MAHSIRAWTAWILALSTLALLTTLALAQEAEQPQGPPIDWTIGPGVAALGEHAEIRIPEDYQFTGPEGTKRLLEVMENPTSGRELGFLAPTDGDWFVVFKFDEIGYVKDDEKDKLDADAILKSIREGTERANEERRKRGWATVEVVGWEVSPRYDTETHNLEWGVRGRSEGGEGVNYNTRLLGRSGVMEAGLVVDSGALTSTLPVFRHLLAGYSFKTGHRYAEYRQGDKIAKYGLTALVVGGAAAAAVKSGLLAKFWKLIVVGVLAAVAFLRRLMGGRKTSPDAR